MNVPAAYVQPRPLVVAASAGVFTARCESCVSEKNRTFESGRAWSDGEDHSDVAIQGVLSPEVESGWFTCRYGHWALVVRRGSDSEASLA